MIDFVDITFFKLSWVKSILSSKILKIHNSFKCHWLCRISYSIEQYISSSITVTVKNAKSVLCVLIIITAALGRKRCCQSWSSSCSSSGRHGCHSLDADPQTTKAGHWCGVTKSLYKSRHGRDTGSLRTTTTSCWTCCLGRRRRIIWPRTAASSCRTSDDLSQPHDGLNAWTSTKSTWKIRRQT